MISINFINKLHIDIDVLTFKYKTKNYSEIYLLCGWCQHQSYSSLDQFISIFK